MITQLLWLLVVVALVAAASWWYRSVNGVARRAGATFSAEALARLGAPKRGPLLLLFTAPGCSSCTTAKQVIDEASGRLGVPAVVADVTQHPTIASAHHVYRAPTTFVVGQGGRALSRISGVPRNGEVDHVLASAQVLGV